MIHRCWKLNCSYYCADNQPVVVKDFLIEESQGPPSIPIAIFIEFDNYNGPAIISTEGKKLFHMPILEKQI